MNAVVRAIKVSGSAIAGMETISPDTARRWLEKMCRNRPLSESKAIEYAIAMDEGQWVENGESIKFMHDGTLFDGQHRLQACILADKPFRSLVVRGIVDPSAFATVDVGKIRPHGDIFAIAGYPDYNNSSAVGMLVYQYKTGLLSGNGSVARRHSKNSKEFLKKLDRLPVKAGVSKEELLRFAEPYKDRIIGAVRFAGSVCKGRLLSKGIVGGLYFLFAEKAEADAKRFFSDLFEGVGLSSSDPVYWLRERLISNMAAPHKLRRGALLHLVCKAWNKRRAGNKTKALKLIEGEEFPVIK